ncbi:hypothetical protein TNCV_554821 [Trichonephila clavipes]|nr:hypothetical protein TNCV_554821 [Trichonephila clavipes]
MACLPDSHPTHNRTARTMVKSAISFDNLIFWLSSITPLQQGAKILQTMRLTTSSPHIKSQPWYPKHEENRLKLDDSVERNHIPQNL